MMIYINFISIALVLSAFFPTQAWSEANSPKSQLQQSSSGCGSANISENSGRIQIKVSCDKITILKSKTQMNSLEINQERLLLAQNPTELRITSAYLQSWLADGQRKSLTLEFANPRDIPIPEIEIDFLDPNSGASIQKLKPIPLNRSQVYREVGSHKFSLPAGGKTALPVAFLDELTKLQPISSNFCAFDAALTLDPPASKQPTLHISGSSQTLNQALLVRARFKSIFDQQLSFTQWIWIVYGKGSDGMTFWYPSRKIWDTLTCIH